MQYLRASFTQQGLNSAISIFNFPEDYIPSSEIASIRYLYQYIKPDYRPCPTLQQLNERLANLLEKYNTEGNVEILSELVDIAMEFNPVLGVRYLDRLREIAGEDVAERVEGLVNARAQAVIVRQETPRANKNTNIYTDTQNVHNSDVNKSVLSAAKNLYNMYRRFFEISSNPVENQKCKDEYIDGISKNFSRKYPQYNDLINKTIKHIKTNVGTFGIFTSLQDVFLSLWFWIQDHKDADVLEIRLINEFDEAKGMCSTGYLARLVNVMQGFTENEDLHVYISDIEQYNAVIKQYLTKILRECTDEKVTEGLIDGNEIYVKYIHTKVKEKLLEWVDEYGKDILNVIPTVVNNFTKVRVFES